MQWNSFAALNIITIAIVRASLSTTAKSTHSFQSNHLNQMISNHRYRGFISSNRWCVELALEINVYWIKHHERAHNVNSIKQNTFYNFSVAYCEFDFWFEPEFFRHCCNSKSTKNRNNLWDSITFTNTSLLWQMFDFEVIYFLFFFFKKKSFTKV